MTLDHATTPEIDHDEPAGTPRLDRPFVRVELGKLPAAVGRSNELLARPGGATFILGDVLVTLEEVDGRLGALPATPTRIGLELARLGRFERVVRSGKDGPVWGDCDPPMKLCTAIADEPGGWRVPSLAGLTEIPILRPDGRVVTRPGYDPQSRLYLHGGPFEPVGDDPGPALDVLKDALSEFTFADERHQAGALALLLTAVCRRALPSAPMFGISAREAGTGKGTLAALAAILATGKRAAEQPWPAGIPEEERKAITSALLAGQPVLILDNITAPLESAALCVLLTAETWSDRLLGGNRLVQLPASPLAVATGNNLTIVGDLCRRVLKIEMDPGCENPELRKFERDLVPWAIENRPALVNAALTVLSCYRRAGSPLPAGFKPLGSFEAWSRLVCGALVWLGEPDPRETMADNRANDPKRLLLARFLAGLDELFGREWLSVGAIMQGASAANDRAPALVDAIEEITVKARGDHAAKIMLGRWLEAHKGRIVDGRRLDVVRDEHGKTNVWRSMRLK